MARIDPRLQAAVRVAAVPHWFDHVFLNAVLPEPLTGAEFQKLTALSFVERFPGRGWNIHERTRNLLRGRLWQEDPERYCELSRRTLDYAGLHAAQGREAEAAEFWVRAADQYDRHGMPLRALECRRKAAERGKGSTRAL